MDAPDRVEDEFVCPEVLRGSLGSQRDTVERIFGVSLTIGNTPNGASEQMWLRLRGSDRDVKAAKMFVRGLVDQEEMQEVFYPAAVNCVFCGARGFFLDCLIKSTSAHIAVVSPGVLLISGLVEPVVRAYSLVTDLLKRYEGGQASSSDTDERGSGELCYSPRAFKALVEKWEDRHILDLLVLPRSVKEALLELVKESGLVSNLTPGELEVESHESSRPGVTLGVPSGPGNDRSEAPGEATEEKQPGQGARSPSKDEDEVQKLSAANTEFLLKFFTAMGFTEEVVKWILAQTGPIEASQILDLIQQEQDYSDREHQSKRNPPCEMDEETVGGAAAAEVGARHADVVSCAQTKEEDDFMLGVLKKAAVSCGYTEHDVAQACSLLPDGSTHLLLLELQKEASAGMEDSGKKAQKPAVTKDNERSGPVGPAGRPDLSDSAEPGANPQLVCTNEAPPPPRPDHTKRPPGPTYAHISRPKPQSRVCSNGALQAQRSLIRFGESGSASTVPSVVVVTGKQRFLEGLQTPFKLQLMDRPGNPKLRTVVIDGSNVAMSHGRGHFFSCRGIALAVQHFWERGHRHISTLLPQWRQKSDPCIREQHFLGELQKLGLLSFTPSREVLGNRITSYDDRLMLQLAQKTDGVIVTNDNLRDLLDESVEWREIIKKRLLQYTFVGDHFMVPDDPLGRGGPHLDQFLTLERRAPDRRDHSFAGAATNVPPVNPPSSQIQVHNFPGAPNGTEERSQSQGQETERVAGHRHTHRTSGDRCPANRTVEATTSLRERLCQVFPGQDNMVMLVLQSNPTENDLNVLSTLLLER